MVRSCVPAYIEATPLNGILEVVTFDKHLGNDIGNISQHDIISRVANDFLTRVNMVKSHFKWLPIDSMYYMFKSYCMPLYGSQLFDISSNAINIFYTAWRKSIRYVLNLPCRTHGSLLHLICNDLPVPQQLCNRFINFFKQLYQSDNSITKLCSHLAINSSHSSVSNRLTHTANMKKMF